MYEDQVLNYLQSINNKTNSLDNNVLNTKVSNDRILYQLQELNSGDKLIQEEIQEVNQSVTLVSVVVMLLVLLNFIERCFK